MSDRGKELRSHDLTLFLQFHDTGDVGADNQKLGPLTNHRRFHLYVPLWVL